MSLKSKVSPRVTQSAAQWAQHFIPSPSSPLISISLWFCRGRPVACLHSVPFKALRARGYTEEKECVLIEGVPVQFLPAYNSLVEEALNQAREIMYEDVPARVLRSEHLLAICLQTGRDKDRERVRILREQAQLDTNFLADILKRHQLEEKWKLWTE